MRIAIGSDHAGFNLKERIKPLLGSLGHEYYDFGTDSPQSVDYPDYGFPVAQAVSRREFDRGILICGTGIGLSIVANKVKGVRAALCTSVEMARVSRSHNDANILVLGGRITDLALAHEIVRVWLTTDFEGGRHLRRVKKVEEFEGTNSCCPENERRKRG